MRVLLPYGQSQFGVVVPHSSVIAIASPPRPLLPAEDESAEVRRALAEPLGAPRLRDLARGRRAPAIIVSDYTRPTPSGRLVPALLEELEAAGVPESGVSVVFAAGTHRPTRPEEMRAILGAETCSRVRTVSHDCDAPDLVYVGTTGLNGTPVWANRTVAEADLRISVSSVEPHQSAGWSGGAKNLLPGVSGRKTIMTHHLLSKRPGVRIGVLEGNPFRQDLEEAAALVGLDFLLQVILAPGSRVARAFAGHWIEAHRAGVRAADEALSFCLEEPADIVLASVGGAPRDSNLWQVEGKGLTRIAGAVREGGVIVMVAECSEGVGDPEMAAALLAGTPDEILAAARHQEYSVAREKVFRIASLLKKADVYLASDRLSPQVLGRLPVRIFPDAQDAVAAAFEKMGPSARVVVVPRTPGVLLRAGRAPAALGVDG